MKNRLGIVKTALVASLATTGLAFAQEEAPPFALAFQDSTAAQERAEPDQERAEREKERAEREKERTDRSRERDERAYQKGKSYLDKHDYTGAIEYFNEVIGEKSPRAEGALYWRAYAENKMGKRDQALVTLIELKKTYPSGRWLEDARALELEVKQASGAPVSPEGASDEDLKLLALNSLINTDPDRTIPMLEKLLKGNNSPKVKERALFVLAQSHSPKGRELIGQIAKGNYNPDLQSKAIEYLSVFGGRESASTLADIYKSTNDPAIKRSILHGFMISGSRDAVLAVARTETNPELRVEAIRQLGAMGAAPELLQLYTPDAPFEVKRAVLQGLFVGGQADKILEIARNEKDPAMRREAIRQLGPLGRTKSGDALPGLYAKETDPGIKREVLNALFIQGNTTALIEIAKKENDPTLKREAVQKLSLIHSKEATDYLMELLNK